MVGDSHVHVFCREVLPEANRWSFARWAATRRVPVRDPADIYPRVGVRTWDPEGEDLLEWMDFCGIDTVVNLVTDWGLTWGEKPAWDIWRVNQFAADLRQKLPAGRYQFTSGALTGIRVADFSHVVAGPVCTMFLADHGAQVIKIERPVVGDMRRGFSIFPDDGSSVDGSGGFHQINRNKASLALNVTTASGREVATVLIGLCDVVVENFRPGVMERLGLGYSELRKVRPDLIYLSMSAYGQSGP